MDKILDYQSFVITVLVSIVTLLLALLVFNFNLRSRRRRKLPPSPQRLPVIGNLHQLGELPHRSLRRLAEKYGPLMHLQLGQIPAIIVSSPEVASEVMKTHDLAFCSRPATPVMMKFSYNGSDMAFTKYGEHWRQLKRLGTLEILSMKRVQHFRNVREEEVHVLIQNIRRSCSQEPVNLSEMFLCMSNNIICREVFGKRFSDDGQCNRSEHHDLVLEIIELMGGFFLADFFPSFKWLSVVTGLQGKLERNFKRMNEFFEREIEEHSLSMKNDLGRDDKEEDDFVDVLLKSQKDSTNLGFSLTRDQIKGVLLNMFLGGTDTSAATLEWAMTELMRYPSIMKKAQDEVRSVVGNKGKVDENDLQHLQYLKFIINETLRLHCIVPLLIPRESRQDCTLFGYDIPKNTRVFVNAWVMARDPKSWHNPEVFMPERFEENAINFKGQHFEFIPFGAGRRICPGIQFGVAAIEIALANILYHFNWELPSWLSYEDIDMTETFGLVLHKRSPLVLMARPINILVKT
ncbi:cytochrome P450 71A1-like [Dioscorea cayenensis subsp. rotundata]|uniref:Cytochrome P450 71A1-like n=1 Tax=Dioscorea cayennensis subsp. rotundata TaxID=55577 RepID=A0AB40D3R8_DIOCR|nr:cytochrome P450 71A1-like [Dioscorea cayenensis subsp. rotundata]